MSLIEFFQKISSTFLSVFFEVFNFLTSNLFFFIFFVIIFLFIKKEEAFKLNFAYGASFFLSALVLKNIIKSKRPYEVNKNLLATNPSFSTFSFPSLATTYVGVEGGYVCKKTKNKGRRTRFWINFLTIFIVLLCALSKVYFAQNFLIDALIGFLIGFVIFYLISLINIKEKSYIWFLFSLVVPVIFFIIFGYQAFSSIGFYEGFEFCGLFSSLIIGMVLESKFIKYTIKNNLIFTSFKVAISLIVLGVTYFLFSYFLVGKCIFSFIKFFVLGLIATLLLPLTFKSLEKYFYCFTKVELKNVKASYISLSLKDTKRIARKILKQINKGDVVLLKGDLGAGKTTLVREILLECQVKGNITSPTFTILNEYETKLNHFYHFDMYRIENEEELQNIGFEDILEDKNAIKFIEWAENAQDYLPKNYKRITLVKLGKNSRNIILEEY